MSIVCHGKLPTGQSGDLEAGPGDLTGLDKLLCYGYHMIQNTEEKYSNNYHKDSNFKILDLSCLHE